MPQYETYTSAYIQANGEEISRACLRAHRKIIEAFPGANPTSSTTVGAHKKFKRHEGYQLYNFFQMSAPNIYIFNVYRELLEFIRFFHPHDGLYLQSWINCQPHSEVLDWHRHEGFIFHGYVCIDPKDTLTEFEGYSIDNHPGLIYIGAGSPRHRVVNRSQYEGMRITIGFDLIEPSDNFLKNQSFIPIL